MSFPPIWPVWARFPPVGQQTGHFHLMKTRFNPFTRSPEVRPEKRTKSPNAARKKPKREKRKKLPGLSEQEALARAQQGNSLSNYPVIFAGFKAKGIPEDQIRPRENVFTFKAWNAQGRKVKKGEHGVKIHTTIETPVKEEVEPDTGDVRVITKSRPWTTTVFHISQTEPIGQTAPIPASPDATKAKPESEKVTLKNAPVPLPATQQSIVPANAANVISVNFDPPTPPEPVSVERPATVLAGWRARLIGRRGN